MPTPIKYRWTPGLEEQLREAYRTESRAQRQRAIARMAAATGWPLRVFRFRAQLLGIAEMSWTRPWTAADIAYLQERAGEVAIHTLARRLKRSTPAVRAKLTRLEISASLRHGYNANDLARCFGVDIHKAQRWLQRGLFGKVHRIGGAEGHRVTEDNVVRFLRLHHSEYDLRRVDQTWLKAMLFGEGACLA